MNVTEATAELKARGFDFLSDDRILFMLNDGKNTFEDYWTWPWLEQTITGPAPLPVDGLKHVYYVQGNETELIELHPTILGDLAQTGTPGYWWASGPTGTTDTVTINTWPVGDITLQARVLAQSPELTDPTDVPLIPARYHPIWIDLAVIPAYRDTDNFPAAAQLQAITNTRLHTLVERYETVNRQHSMITAQRFYSEDD